MNDLKTTILIAEDDSLTRKSMAHYLQGLGFCTIEATNGNQALEVFKENKPDLLMTDLRMPELDGMLLLKSVVNDFPETPVIIVSGMGTFTDAIEALRFGAWDYITKPIQNMALLRHSVEKAMERVHLLLQKKRHHQSLEVEVAQRTAALHQQNVKLELEIKERKKADLEKEKLHYQLLHAQKLESVGQLAAGIAHEINTPIQFIGTNVDFLNEAMQDIVEFMRQIEHIQMSAQVDIAVAIQNAMEKADWEYLAEELPLAIDQCQDGVKRVSSIVRAMKEFSHPGGREKKLSNLNKIVKTTVTVARNEWKYVAEVVLELDDDIPFIPLLTDEIGQVILNILVNAAHAIAGKLGQNPEGNKGTIAIKTRLVGDSVELVIRDNGTGIPEKARARIFDPFFTTKEVGRGTGQGLAISHDVIKDKHGGQIDFKTENDKGTEFVISLPVKLVDPALSL